MTPGPIRHETWGAFPPLGVCVPRHPGHNLREGVAYVPLPWDIEAQAHYSCRVHGPPKQQTWAKGYRARPWEERNPDTQRGKGQHSLEERLIARHDPRTYLLLRHSCLPVSWARTKPPRHPPCQYLFEPGCKVVHLSARLRVTISLLSKSISWLKLTSGISFS